MDAPHAPPHPAGGPRGTFDSHRPEFRHILFVAHGEEILQQTWDTFRRIQPDARLGFYMAQQREADADVLFASIQTLGRVAHLALPHAAQKASSHCRIGPGLSARGGTFGASSVALEARHEGRCSLVPAAVHLTGSTQVAEVTLDEVVAQLKKDPGRPVRARVGELTIEVRAVDEQEPARSAADVFAELGPWAGESTEEILRLLAEARRSGGQRPVLGL